MIVNLFSSFDPSTIAGSFNWTSSLLILILWPTAFFTRSFKVKLIFNKIIEAFLKETNIIIKGRKLFSLLIRAVFIFIATNNFIGLFPYVFTSTRHIRATLTLSLVVWLALILFGWTVKNKDMFAHLVPIRTPGALIPFIVIIERIRRIIRPLTLAIRLSANMIAGHLLLTLLGNQLANLRMLGLILPTEIILVVLEIAVSLIQAYVFSILIALYIREVSEESH